MVRVKFYTIDKTGPTLSPICMTYNILQILHQIWELGWYGHFPILMFYSQSSFVMPKNHRTRHEHVSTQVTTTTKVNKTRIFDKKLQQHPAKT